MFVAVIVTDCPSLDWIKDVPPDISVRLVRTTKSKITVALRSDGADAHVMFGYEAFADPSTVVTAAVAHLQAKASMETVIREAQAKPTRLLVN